MRRSPLSGKVWQAIAYSHHYKRSHPLVKYDMRCLRLAAPTPTLIIAVDV
ncbi:hypothetical protein H6G36_21840 [Anabaena minutissima FACHB-250]|nr:hypothetical protein [Anabaena minutissima FACHB-250]